VSGDPPLSAASAGLGEEPVAEARPHPLQVGVDLVYRSGNPWADGHDVTDRFMLSAVHDPKWLDGGDSMVVQIAPPIQPDGTYQLGEDGIATSQPPAEGPAAPILWRRDIPHARREPGGNFWSSAILTGRIASESSAPDWLTGMNRENMRKSETKDKALDLRPHYDFKCGVRRKYVRRFAGSVSVVELEPKAPARDHADFCHGVLELSGERWHTTDLFVKAAPAYRNTLGPLKRLGTLRLPAWTPQQRVDAL
jgi:hypothetical protein